MEKPAPSFGPVPAQRAADEAAHHRAGDTQQNSDDQPTGIAPGISSFAIAPTIAPKRIQPSSPNMASTSRGAQCKLEALQDGEG